MNSNTVFLLKACKTCDAREECYTETDGWPVLLQPECDQGINISIIDE